MTFDSDITVPLMKDMAKQAPQAICELRPSNVKHRPDREYRGTPIRQSADPQSDGAGHRSKAFIEILAEGKASTGGAMLPAPEGLLAHAAEEMAKLPGYGADTEKNRAEARKIMEALAMVPARPSR